MNYKDIAKKTIAIVKQAGALIVQEKAKSLALTVEKKGLHDYVTHVDKASEAFLVEHLGNLIPESGFIAEEGTSSKRGETYNWIIDPIDGTTNFIHNIPCFCVSVALAEGKDVVVGVVLEINQNECFYSYKGGKAYCNDKEISVSSTDSLEYSLVATGFPYNKFNQLQNYMDLLANLMQNTSSLRRLGSAAADLVYVACGRFDSFYEYNLNPWDIAAGAFIVQQAGGLVSDFSGGPHYKQGKSIVASNPKIQAEMLRVIQSHMEPLNEAESEN